MLAISRLLTLINMAKKECDAVYSIIMTIFVSHNNKIDK